MSSQGMSEQDAVQHADRADLEHESMSDLGRAIRPNIFDVFADPTVVMPMVVANLLSPTLWDHVARLGGNDGRTPLLERMSQIQRLMDRWLQHLSPAQVLALDGVLHLDHERDRLGASTVDRALDSIRRTIHWRTKRGTLPAQDPLLRSIDEGTFPCYVYGTIDELVAHRRMLGRPSGRPRGLSSCLDEAALLSSFLAAQPLADIHGIVLLGSAAHYTVLSWTGEPDGADFRAGWFYGKNTLLTDEDYRRIIAQDYAGDAALAFADRMPVVDFILSRRGTWHLTQGRSSIPASERVELVSVLDAFFGGRLEVIDDAVRRTRADERPSAFDELIAACAQETSHAGVRPAVLRKPSAAAQEALACHRDMQYLDLSHFQAAAQRGTMMRTARLEARNADDVARRISSIAGTQSPFRPAGMLAMPEEVLRYGTGTPQDRELLTWALSQ